MFRRNILPPSAGWKSKPRKKLAEAGSEQWRIPTGYRNLLPASAGTSLLFEPEDGGDIFLRNVGRYNPEHRIFSHRHESLTCNMRTWRLVESWMVRQWANELENLEKEAVVA
jgi:hypothetical protein